MCVSTELGLIVHFHSQSLVLVQVASPLTAAPAWTSPSTICLSSSVMHFFRVPLSTFRPVSCLRIRLLANLVFSVVAVVLVVVAGERNFFF